MSNRVPLTRTALLLSLASLLTACARPRPAVHTEPAAAPPGAPVESVNAGIYEASDPSDPAARIELFLSPNHGFILRHSPDQYGPIEYRGRWSSDPDSLRLAVWDIRRGAAGDSTRVVERLDSVISCPIASGAIQPLPLLRLESPQGGPRLLTLAKPPESPEWDSVKPGMEKGTVKGRKKDGKKVEPRTKTAKAAPASTKPVRDTKLEEGAKGRKDNQAVHPAARTGA